MSAKRLTFCLLLAIMAFGSRAQAQRVGRGSATRRANAWRTIVAGTQSRRPVQQASHVSEAQYVDDFAAEAFAEYGDPAAVYSEPIAEYSQPAAEYSEPIADYGNPSAADTWQAGDTFCDSECGGCGPSDLGIMTSNLLAVPRWSAGVEFTLLRPHFESNPAFTTLVSDGDTTNDFTQTEFQFDRELSPRVWVEALSHERFGVRATWWNFDHSAETAIGIPDANGFGEISHPPFGTVDISTTIPDSQLTANHELNATTVDIEATKALQVGCAGWLTGFGFRFADLEQSYNAVTQDENGVTTGTIDYLHQIEGFGPTISIRTSRPFTNQLSIFGAARGSLIFGDGESQLTAVEDVDIDDSLTTTETLSRDDLLPIGELQLGLQWTPPAYGVWIPYLHFAMEGQVWSGAGNASSEDHNLGFFGFNVAVGIDF